MAALPTNVPPNPQAPQGKPAVPPKGDPPAQPQVKSAPLGNSGGVNKKMGKLASRRPPPPSKKSAHNAPPPPSQPKIKSGFERFKDEQKDSASGDNNSNAKSAFYKKGMTFAEFQKANDVDDLNLGKAKEISQSQHGSLPPPPKRGDHLKAADAVPTDKPKSTDP